MKTETRNFICFEKKLIIALSSVHLTNFVKTEFASSSVHSNMEFQRRRTTKNRLRMVVHNYRRVWTREEKKANYEHGLMYCVVHGFDKFKKMGKNYLFNGFFIFNLTFFFIFKKYSFIYFLIFFFFRTRKLVDNWDVIRWGGTLPIKTYQPQSIKWERPHQTKEAPPQTWWPARKVFDGYQDRKYEDSK